MGLQPGIFPPRRMDSKEIHRALFGVTYEEDIYDKFCQKAPLAMRAFWWRTDEQMRRRNLIFIHVPRAAGTSISCALFGPRNTLHYSIRYYKTVHPRFYAAADSFAVLRDPMDRFASAYSFVRAGGTPTCRLSDVFVKETAYIRSVDDYLSYLEARDAFGMDFVMRPQSWFVSDLKTGAVLVKKLFLLGQDTAQLATFLQGHGVAALSRLNPSARTPMAFAARQKSRIEALYAQDFALVEQLRKARVQKVPAATGIAAE